MNINRSIAVTIIILLIAIIYFGISDIDIEIQDYLYNFKNHSWLLNRDLEPWHTIFYSGIKKLLILIAIAFLLTLLFFWKKESLQAYKKGLIIVVISAVTVPLSVGYLKKTTNMPCPKHEIHYGGNMPKTAVWQVYKEPYSKRSHIACWPAGHASGGFALLSLYFLFLSRRNKTTAIIAALTVGWAMGIYKMAIGDHFFSHTVITMLLAWLITLLVAKAVLREKICLN